MAEQWKHQIRVVLEPEAAVLARDGMAAPDLAPLTAALAKHDALLKSQYDAFAGYCAEAEEHGVENYPLYEWTKATIDDPAKKTKYLSVFTVYAGGQEVYEAAIADALMEDLEPLVGGPVVSKLSRHDTNPANNPQMPKKYRRT